jgi:D-sedoheptulose 7-phosphate isomerase
MRHTVHMNPSELVLSRIDGSLAAIASLRDHLQEIVAIAELLRVRFKGGGKLYTCGNGGSASQAMHLAEELIGRYRSNRKPYPTVCLNADPTALTCIANDFGFEHVFARQCEALLAPDDVLLVLSTSGNSDNLVNGLKLARSRKCATVGLLGRSGGACGPLCDCKVVLADTHADSAFIQDAHQVIIHLICEFLEQV